MGIALEFGRAKRTGMPMREFLGLVKEDWNSHNRDFTRVGFKALFIFRFGCWRMRLRRGPGRGILGYIYRYLYRRSCWKYGIEIPWGARIGRRLTIHHTGQVVVSGYSAIGDDCVLRHNVTLGIRHGQDDSPILGNRVDVGCGATILGAIRIGDDCKIGANSVVLQDMPAGSIAVGVPARIILRTSSGDDVTKMLKTGIPSEAPPVGTVTTGQSG
jgi:serine O-acetyltransferase